MGSRQPIENARFPVRSLEGNDSCYSFYLNAGGVCVPTLYGRTFILLMTA